MDHIPFLPCEAPVRETVIPNIVVRAMSAIFRDAMQTTNVNMTVRLVLTKQSDVAVMQAHTEPVLSLGFFWRQSACSMAFQLEPTAREMRVRIPLGIMIMLIRVSLKG